MKQTNSRLSTLTRGILRENPVLVLVLGTCPTLAVTTNVIGALAMGLAAMAVLVCSNTAISLLRKIVPDSVRIPCYIVVIAGFVTVVQMLMEAFLPDLYNLLGVYLALIVVNCIILGRAEMFAREHTVGDSVLDGVGMGLGFTLALVAMATLREVFGNGAFAGMVIGFWEEYRVPILTMAPGGFFVFGLLMALAAKITGKKMQIKGCSGCPSASLCRKNKEDA